MYIRDRNEWKKFNSTRPDSTEPFTRLGSTRHLSEKDLTRLDSTRPESSRVEPPSVDSKSNVQKYILNIKYEKKFSHTVCSYHSIEAATSDQTESKRIASGNCADFLEAVFEIGRSQVFPIPPHQNRVFVAQKRLEVIAKVRSILDSTCCFCVLLIFEVSLSKTEVFVEFSTLFEKLKS